MKLDILLALFALSNVCTAVQLTKENLESTCRVNSSKIECENANIESVANDAFSNYGKSIITLVLTNNSISKLESGTFASLTKLVLLELDNNKLSTLPGDLFHSENRIEILSLSHNQFTELDGDLFKSLKTLSDLDLSYNQIESVKNLDQITHIYGLFLSGNKFQSIKDGQFQSLVELSNLYLDSNMIDSVHPGFMGSNNKLKVLQLSNNRLKKLTGEQETDGFTGGYFQQVSLVRLHLSNNMIETIETGIIPSTVSWLELNQNALTQIPTKQLFCRRLIFLELCGNKLDYLDEFTCQSVERIYSVWKAKYGFNTNTCTGQSSSTSTVITSTAKRPTTTTSVGVRHVAKHLHLIAVFILVFLFGHL